MGHDCSAGCEMINCSLFFPAQDYQVHLPTFQNKMHQNEGRGMRDVLVYPGKPLDYWSSYNRIHNKLGTMLGPGVPHQRPVRREYNILTGKKILSQTRD